MRTIGVVGLGKVGGTVLEAMQGVGITARGYDLYLDIGKPEDMEECAIVFLCVPTPGADDGSLDTSAVWAAVDELKPHLVEGTIVAVKSTVPPGTSDALAETYPHLEFASVPEFLVAARAMETLTKPNRVVIGARSAEPAESIAEVMRRVAPGAPILVMRPIEAELAKLSANAMLAAKVSMANELALVCERFGVAWSNIQPVVGLDRRIGPDHLTVSPERGFSGGCLPKDFDGLIAAARSRGDRPRLLEAIASFNRSVRRNTAAVRE